MSAIFIVSSIGDTELALNTINEILSKNSDSSCYILPLTETAANKVQSFPDVKHCKVLSRKTYFENGKDSIHGIKILNDEIDTKQIKMAYIGVPAPNDESLPYALATELSIPCVIANEFMYYDPEHPFWQNLSKMVSDKITFAMPLQAAVDKIIDAQPKSKTSVIGHLSIDKALAKQEIKPQEKARIRNQLEINDNQEYIFISGTTQPVEIDSEFIQALLNELNTGSYPNIQLRMGLHPGVKDINSYLEKILTICKTMPNLQNQFKIIIPNNIKSKIINDIILSDDIYKQYTIEVDMNGPTASSAADKIAQAVPGALVNEGIVSGVPGYFHKNVQSYLPAHSSIRTFLSSNNSTKLSTSDLELDELSVAQRVATLLSMHKK